MLQQKVRRKTFPKTKHAISRGGFSIRRPAPSLFSFLRIERRMAKSDETDIVTRLGFSPRAREKDRRGRRLSFLSATAAVRILSKKPVSSRVWLPSRLARERGFSGAAEKTRYRFWKSRNQPGATRASQSAWILEKLLRLQCAEFF